MFVASEEPAMGWALRLPVDSAAAALSLRLVPNVEVRRDESALWLRGRSSDESLQRHLLRLPASARYAWSTASGALRPLASRLASAHLPVDRWTSLRAWVAVQWPAAALPARMPGPVALRLEPGCLPRAARAWLGAHEAFVAWTHSAPLVRLGRLRFATCADGRSLVLGVPTPPIPGRLFVEEGGIVTPAGFQWEPRVSAVVLRRALGVVEGTVILWDESGARPMPEELFVPATRGAARATLRGLIQRPSV